MVQFNIKVSVFFDFSTISKDILINTPSLANGKVSYMVSFYDIEVDMASEVALSLRKVVTTELKMSEIFMIIEMGS